jgi:hypothetical protein
MTEPKYLLTLFEINKLIYERNMIDESDVAPYLFKDGWVKCSEGKPDESNFVSLEGMIVDCMEKFMTKHEFKGYYKIYPFVSQYVSTRNLTKNKEDDKV